MTTVDRTSAEQAVAYLLTLLGEDVEREGLLNTPARVVRAFEEMLAGNHQMPGEILATTFDEPCDAIVLVTGIRFTSLCEHHLLPFVGTADIGYLPDKKVVGLSKLPRLVECFARRLQVQERMTRQVAEAIDRHLEPLGVAVIARAHHSCMGCRGVRQQDAEMVTSSMLGAFRDNATLRAEFLSLLKLR
jgi:GTP cyclohydrolase I